MKDQKTSNKVHVLTNKIQMRFAPIVKPEYHPKHQQLLITTRSVISSLKSYILPKRQPTSSSAITSISKILSQKQLPQITSEIPKPLPDKKKEKIQDLKFALMFTPEHLLIGNQSQLDLIHIQMNANNYVETEYLWSITNKKKMTHVCIEHKKNNLLLIIAEKTAFIYSYDSKKIPTETPTHIKQIQLQYAPKFVHIIRQSNICLFYQNRLEIFVITNSIRRRYDDKYHLPQIDGSKFSLFYVPQNFQNYVSIFFQEKSDKNPNIFILWCIQVEFTATEIKAHPIQKIYEIKESLKHSIKLNNYSKQIFLLNLGNEVLALKRGYVLDSANVYMQLDQSLLQYVGNQLLLHITTKKIEVYHFSINLMIKPFKILIEPRDSIKINGLDQNYKYFRVLPIFSQDYIVIFKNHTTVKKGQLEYAFYITRKLTREEKMLQLFPKTLTKFKIQDPLLLEKCDMAQKMGYSKKQIYLELWNRSQKMSKQDYSTLIATQDYQTISEEIVRKLKKSSVHLKQVLETQYACLQMLRHKLYSANCTYEIAMNYISCHFFKRKLEMFKSIKNRQRLEQQQNKKQQRSEMKITIRQYQFYKSMELKNQLLTYITQLCDEANQENKRNLSMNIRFLLRHFRFALRTKYEQILEQIIKNTKANVLILLKQIPQILPYHPGPMLYPSYIEIGFYEGVWSEISKQQWHYESLYVDKLTIIDNKQVITEQVIKHINFKRFWLSQHDMVTLSTDQIKENYNKIKSSHIFYFFIAKLFEYIEDEEDLKNIVNYLEDVYSVKEDTMENSKTQSISRGKRKQEDKKHKIPGIPQNIKGKVFLLQKIYRFFEYRDLVPIKNGQPCTLIKFFYFQDHQLIKYCFQKQRSTKGILLKDIKSIYKQCLINHAQVFNQALLHYFMTDASQISDLKYILNRINNQKTQFHIENREMYAVLVEALQRKLKIGTGKDIPIDQVLIYLENIPFHSNEDQNIEQNPVFKQLQRVHAINQQSLYLQQSRINMSIYDILRNPEEVFTHLIEYILKTAPAKIWSNPESFITFTTSQINEVEHFAENIYSGNDDLNTSYSKTIFFIFLAKLCQVPEHIKFAKILLNDKNIPHSSDEFTGEGLVQFMYKWKMSTSNSFLQNEYYILELLKLIPQHSNTYIFIHNELQFAKLLSYGFANQITFPISQTILNCRDIKDIVNDLPIQFVMRIDIVKVYEIVHNIQSIAVEKIDIEKQIGGRGGLGEELQHVYHKSCMDRSTSIDPNSLVTLPQIYQIFIIKYLNQKKLKQVIKHIKQLLALPKQNQSQNYNIIFPILYTIHLSAQLNEQNKQNLLQCIWYYFYQPLELMNILEYIVVTALTPHQLKKQIERRLLTGKEMYQGYSPKNCILNPEYINYIGDNRQYEITYSTILRRVCKHILDSKQQFKNIKYHIILIILCNSPYLLAKFIECSDQRNIKSIRSLLSYAILEDIFQPIYFLELARRVFLILLESFARQFPIQIIVEEFSGIDIKDEMEIDDYQPADDQQNYQETMWKSAQAFRKKKKFIHRESVTQSKIFKKQKNIQEKLKRLFMGQQRQLSIEPSSYIFEDSDNEQKLEMDIRQSITKRKAKKSAKFIPKAQRMAIFQSTRINKPSTLYKSIQNDFNFRKSRGFFVTSHQSLVKAHSHLEVKSPPNPKSSNISSSESIQIPALQIQITHKQSARSQQQSQQQNQVHLDIQSDNEESPIKSSPDIRQIKKTSSSKQFIESTPQNHVRLNSQIKQTSQLSKSQISNLYQIHVNQVNDQENDQQKMNQLLEESKNVDLGANQLSIEVLAKLLIDTQYQEKFLEGQYDLGLIQCLRGNSFQIVQLIRQLYSDNINKPTLHKSMRIISEIVVQFSPSTINKEMFKIMTKMQQAQSKTIPEIPFSSLISSSTLVKFYANKKQIFDEVYRKLHKFVGSENIYTISQFVRRVFDDRLFEQQVIWDFVLDLCEKIDHGAPQEKQWNLEKIQATLPKIDVVMWNINFEKFRNKVIESDLREQLLEIFYRSLKDRQNKQQSLKFIKSVQQFHTCEECQRILRQLDG